MQSVVKKLRERAQLSQQALAQRLGVSLASIQGWEAGRNISPNALQRVLDFAREGHFDDILDELEPTAPGAEATNDEQRWVKTLLAVLRSGDHAAVDAVQKNLLLARRLTKQVKHGKTR